MDPVCCPGDCQDSSDFMALRGSRRSESFTFHCDGGGKLFAQLSFCSSGCVLANALLTLAVHRHCISVISIEPPNLLQKTAKGQKQTQKKFCLE